MCNPIGSLGCDKKSAHLVTLIDFNCCPCAWWCLLKCIVCVMSDWLQGLIITFSIPNPIKFIKNAKIAFIHIGQNSIMYMCIRLLWCSFIAYILICIYSVDGCFSFGLLCCWIIAPRVLCVLSCRPFKRRLIIHDTVRPIHSSSMRLNDSQFFASITPFLPFWFDFFFAVWLRYRL